MKYQLAHELEIFKKELGLTQTNLSSATEVDVGTLSRVKSGGRQMTYDELAKIRRVYATKGLWPARLLRARLLEDCTGPGANQISIEIDGTLPALAKEAGPPYLVGLAPKVDQAMRRIAANISGDAKLRDLILYVSDHLDD